jgi:SAM-dependent MidA family methyltransferase
LLFTLIDCWCAYTLIYYDAVEPLKKSDIQTLAQPGDEAKQRSQQLIRYIREACEREGGAIRFSEFMAIALYQPGLGYYSGGLQKFGARGDFITAPEVSALFGQCLANQLDEVFQNFKRSSDKAVNVIEFGAGSGVLALDILLQLEKLDSLPEQYFILELSAELQHRQKQTIKQKAPHLYAHVHWLQQVPADLSNVVVIANEVLDAMPVECFRVSDIQRTREIEALAVTVDGDKLLAEYHRADDAVIEKIRSIEQRSEIRFADGYCSEFNPAIEGWLSELEDKIERAVILLIDYGYNEAEYYHPDRSAGTLMCYYQHKAHGDYLWWPGLQDITAFVNFTDVAYSAHDHNLEVAGYTTQAAFLLANGLPELHAAQVTDEVKQQVKMSQQIKTLTLPSEMGDRFKVMALTKNYDEPLQGFSMLDLRNRL